MEFSEKLLKLRKAKDLTQEELAEKLNISRQSVSKWESGQAVPELDKIVALSDIFDVTTDYLLKSSEIEEMPDTQQELQNKDKKRNKIKQCVIYVVGIYLIFIAIYIIGHFYFEIWNPSVILAEFLIAAAISIFISIRHLNKE